MQTLSLGKILYQKFGLYQGPRVGGEISENVIFFTFYKFPSLQAFRAETMVGGLPRAFRLFSSSGDVAPDMDANYL